MINEAEGKAECVCVLDGCNPDLPEFNMYRSTFHSDPGLEDLLAIIIFEPVCVREKTETVHNGNVIKRQLVSVLMWLTHSLPVSNTQPDKHSLCALAPWVVCDPSCITDLHRPLGHPHGHHYSDSGHYYSNHIHTHTDRKTE